MPKYNKFSELYEPDKDTCTEASEDNIVRFREAQLKVDRISNGNEKELTFKIATIATRYNKTGEKISFDLDYADAMSALENVYNDVDANMMIMALEALASDYGYLPEMDNEEIELEEEMFWFSKEDWTSLLTRMQTEYNRLSGEVRKKFKGKIAGGMRTWEMERNPRPDVHRGEVWRTEIPVAVGRETNGYRWVIIISNEKHAECSDVVNVVYLDGEKPKNKISHMGITNANLEDGSFEKEGRVNITDLYSMDKKKLLERKGKVNDYYMNCLMDRIAKQLGMK